MSTASLRDLRRSLRAFADAIGPSTLGHSLTEAQDNRQELPNERTAA